MFDDISFLVQETLKDAGTNSKGRGFFSSFANNDVDIPEDACGVLYRIQQNAATFVIRIHPCDDLKSEYTNILKHPSMYPGLRFEDEVIENELHYFLCDDLRIAQKLKEKLGNKRFPIKEEQVFNLSDPGDSWWLKREETKISIFFKLSHTEQMEELIKLGPLGDPETSLKNFSKLYGYFEMLFPLEDYSSGFGQFSFKTKESGNPMFEQIFRLLNRGDVGVQFWEYLRDLERVNQNKPFIGALQKANYFLMELAQTRRFWLEVTSKI